MDDNRPPAAKQHMRNTLLASLGGPPGHCLLVDVAEDGLPVGAQLKRPFGADADLLNLGLRLQAIWEQGGRQ